MLSTPPCIGQSFAAASAVRAPAKTRTPIDVLGFMIGTLYSPPGTGGVARSAGVVAHTASSSTDHPSCAAGAASPPVPGGELLLTDTLPAIRVNIRRHAERTLSHEEPRPTRR